MKNFKTTATNAPSTLKAGEALLDFQEGFNVRLCFTDDNGKIVYSNSVYYNSNIIPDDDEIFFVDEDDCSADDLDIDNAINILVIECALLRLFLIEEDAVIAQAKGHAVGEFFSELPCSGYDYEIFMAEKDYGYINNYFQVCEEHEGYPNTKLASNVSEHFDYLMAFSATHQEVQPVMSGSEVYLACEFDDYRSSSSRVIQGIFSTKEKAIAALTKLYGKLKNDSNGGDMGFVPVNNPHDVTLSIITASIDAIDEV
jgi:hypothetical protein